MLLRLTGTPTASPGRPKTTSIWVLCAEFPSLSWLAKTPEAALKGIGKVVANVVADMQASGEPVPEPMAEKHYSGEFKVRIPPQLHCNRPMMAAEQGVSLNRMAGA